MKNILLFLLILLFSFTAEASQNSISVPTVGPLTALQLTTDINAATDTLATNFSGTAAPGTPLTGQFWLDTTNSYLKIYDGSAFQIMGRYSGSAWNAIASAFIPSGSVVPTNGMYLSAANTLDFSTNTANALEINSTQQVGIGGAPAEQLHIIKSQSAGTYIKVTNSSANASALAGLEMDNGTNVWRWYIPGTGAANSGNLLLDRFGSNVLNIDGATGIGTYGFLWNAAGLSIGTETAGGNGLFTGTLGAEQMPNFTSSNWTITAGWEATNDGGTQLDHNAAGVTTITPSAATTIVAGTLYKVVITMNAMTVGTGATYTLGGVAGSALNSASTFTDYIKATTTGNLIITPAVTTTRFTINSVSVKPITTNTGTVTALGDIKLAGRLLNPTGTIGLQLNTAGTGIFGGALTIAGALTGVTTAAMSSTITDTTANLLYVSTDAIVQTNTTAATAVAPVQISGRIRQTATGWDGASRTINFKQEVQPLYDPSIATGRLVWGYGYNAVTATAFLDAMALGSEGTLDVYGTTLAAESLTNGALTSGTSWSVTGDFALTANAATYTKSSGVGTLSQASGTLAVAGVANRWYVFNYTTSTVVSGVTCYIDTTFAAKRIYFNLVAGTYSIFFKSAAAPGNFTLQCTATAGNYTIDTLSLKQVTSGNITANGLFTGGGSSGIKVDGSGNVGIGSTTPTVPLDVVGAVNSTGTVTALTFSGAGTGLTGTAASLTAGTASAVAASALTGTTLASGVVTSSLTTVATIGSGIWNAGAVTSTGAVTGVDFVATGNTVPANGLYLPAANTLGWATNSVQVMTLNSSGFLGIGTSSATSRLQTNGAISASSWTTTGINLSTIAATYTDTSTAASGTVATRAANSFGIPTFASTNTSVTVTTGANLYIAGAPANGTNTTVTNGYALYVAAGNSLFGGIVTGNSFIPTSSTIPTNGMYLSAANTLDFSTNSTNAIEINTSQNVGIGVAPVASRRLTLENDADSAAASLLIQNSSTGTTAAASAIYFGNSTSAIDAYIFLTGTNNSTYGGARSLNILTNSTNNLSLGVNGASALLFTGSTGDATFNNKLTVSKLATFATGIIAGGTKFTTSGCSVSATVGGAFAGTYTSGTSGTCTVVITINGATGATAPTGWTCYANDETTPVDVQHQIAPHSATTATISGTTVSGDVVSFGCIGY